MLSQLGLRTPVHGLVLRNQCAMYEYRRPKRVNGMRI